LLSGVDGDYKYVISSKSIDLRERIKDINKSLLGKGGGKSNMVQGSFSANISEIKAYFNL
jgi:alanyl-tRNA synthetase